MTKKVVISGAGLVGSLLAVTLKKRGFDVTVYERRSDIRNSSADAGRSINLILTAKGREALKAVDLEDEILAKTVPVLGRMMHSVSGELSYQPYGRDDSECNFSVSRAMLNKEMMTIAEREGVEIKFEESLESINFETKTIQFSKSTNISYDLLFGTDGAGSQTRKELIKFTGGTERTEPLGADYKELFMPASPDGDYVIDKDSLHIWPRGSHMLMSLANPDGSFTMTLYLPTEEFEKIKTKEDIEKHFQENYPDAIPLMPNYKEEYFENPTGFLGTVRCDTWTYKDSVCLLGDAAHAIVPFFGQGMNSGFQDITYLTKMMDRYGDDFSKVFAEFEKEQKPNGNAIADMAIDNFIEMKDRVGDQHFLLKKQIEHKIENAFPKTYRSRYAMVVYSLIPYRLCQQAGPIQNEILEELARDINNAEELDLKKAESLIASRFKPFVEKNSLSF